MFGLHTLDIAIGLVFTYLVLSLTCTAINELVAALARSRSSMLKEGITRLLTDDAFRKKVYEHPLIASLHRRNQHPSYIPQGAFAQAVLDSVAPPNASGSRTLPDIQRAIGQLPDGDLKRALLSFADAANGELQKLQAGVEGWFNNTMDRVSGWYKRRVQLLTVGWALLITVALNADSIRIGGILANDPERLAQVVKGAIEFARNDSVRKVLADTSSRTAADSGSGTVSLDSLLQRAAAVQNQAMQISGSGLPLGWTGEGPRPREKALLWLLSKVGGLILTAAAISLGAPFWFDVLNRFVNIRAAGAAPGEKPPGKS